MFVDEEGKKICVVIIEKWFVVCWVNDVVVEVVMYGDVLMVMKLFSEGDVLFDEWQVVIFVNVEFQECLVDVSY